MHFDYHIPTKIIFGRGRLKELATEELPGSKALIVITNGQSMKRLGYLNQVTQYLKENGVDSVLFDKVLPNPTLAHVSEAAELARRENCDMVVGLGGGSAIDSAKAIALAATNPGNYWEYVKGREVENAALPIVAIPTTAGTGTESDPWTVITNLETNEKIGFGIKQLFPTLSIVDPELMVSVPANLTAYQGMDAFFHSAEGYLAKVAQPLSDLFALNSIRRIAKFLPEAVKDGNNLQAREEMAWASRYGGEHFLLYFRAFDGACPVGLLSGAAARRRSGCAFGTVFYASSEKRREESGAALYGHGPGDGRGKRQFAIGFYYGFEKAD